LADDLIEHNPSPNHELAAHLEQVKLQKQQDSHAFEYAINNLEATERDNQNLRASSERFMKMRLIFFAAALLMILLFSGVALYFDKEKFLLSLLHDFGLLGGGLLGGGGAMYSYFKFFQSPKK
jgi:hypothetical protein